jgi:hypothetical protein
LQQHLNFSPQNNQLKTTTMEIIYNHRTDRSNAFSSIRGGKDSADILRDGEKDLLGQMAQALTIVYGGEPKRRRGMTA